MDIEKKGLKIHSNPLEIPVDNRQTIVISEVSQESNIHLSNSFGATALEATMNNQEKKISRLESKESLVDQLPTTYAGYKAVIESLNVGHKKEKFKATDENTFISEFKTWFKDDKLGYILDAQECNPDLSFTIIATPNLLIGPKKIIHSANLFGENQPKSTLVWDELISTYSASQLCGTNPDSGNLVSFSLMPNLYNPEIGGKVVAQREKLSELKEKNNNLKIPSVFDMITYWNTLRSNGDLLSDDAVFTRTYVCHIDLPEQYFGGNLGIPSTCVNSDGRPLLSYSDISSNSRTRVSVS
jgi:hypothetical protein